MRTDSESPEVANKAGPVRLFGRFQLLRLLGKSERTMAWRVADPRVGQELILVLPRHQPADADELDYWTQKVRRASRVQHPYLAAVVEQGVQDGWPFAAYDAGDSSSLAERLGGHGLVPAEVAAWACKGLEGLAFAHEAGLAHQDLQPYLVWLDAQGSPRLMGVEVALDARQALGEHAPFSTTDPSALRAQRVAAQRDVLSFGLLMHVAISGSAVLDEPDIGRVIADMPPSGREIVRLPWTTAHPVPEALRAICNRATDRQERHRYHNARTLARALEGWIKANDESQGGPLALLLDRLHSVGLLPASPGAAARVARMALMEKERTNEIAAVVLQDFALSFEMLRNVNSAQVRGAQVAGTGPVLTIRRAILMLGLDGVRHAALGLRPWPGPLSDEHAVQLQRLFERVQRAGRVAQALRPAGYDQEVSYLVTLLQNLGRLSIQYHFPEEARQIRHLMKPVPTVEDGASDEPGMSEEAASYAVLGVDTEALGAAVARHWGLDSTVLHMIRRLPLAAPVRAPDNDDDVLRALASCATEAVDALSLPSPQIARAVKLVSQRYSRVLDFRLRDLQIALDLAPRNAGNAAEFEDTVLGAPS